ncbi:MAG TPA: hypothetical protein VJ976_00600 [Ornithinimicrobium sp.]|uniref:hypothetical protein n=1 Tax=Ornithinimicrobium sp. TaxID=1977084 RepID=UPI002B46743E|nr:hypothetical protein [Ornithinimicrobium sp.]HKJ10865.1 hypothetical protein [Ornithinimicrobium sp.]
MGEASGVALWSAVVLAGLYHGLNPGMGWPLAVSAALMERRPSALARSLALLGLGHFLAMAVVLLPFSLIGSLVQWEMTIRLVASGIAVGYGLFLLLSRSHHPRYLARVAPHRLVWWSFLAATAHGAGLMLLPIFLSMNQMAMDGDHGAMMRLVGENAAPAVFVALVHTLAMVAAGALLAVLVYRWLGVKAVSRTWFNLDVVWALSLLLVGLLSAAQALWW